MIDEDERTIGGVTYRAVDATNDGYCYGCAADHDISADLCSKLGRCGAFDREDGRDVIWQEVSQKTAKKRMNKPPKRITLRTVNNRLARIEAQIAKLLAYREAELSRDVCGDVGTEQQPVTAATGLAALPDKPDRTAIQLILLAKRRPADWPGPRVKPKAGKRRGSGLPEAVRVTMGNRP